MERTGAWYLVRLELALGVGLAGLAALAGLAILAQGGGPIGTSSGHVIMPAAGIVGAWLGVAWMVRIIRADPEGGAPAWRYRDRR